MTKGKGSRAQLIAKKISETEEFRIYRSEFLENLHNCNIIETRHRYSSHSSEATSDIFLSWGAPPGRIMARKSPSQEEIFIDFSLKQLIDSNRLCRIIEIHQGKSKLGGCKPETVKDELINYNASYFIDITEFREIRQSVKKRIWDYTRSEEFFLSKSKAYDDFAILEIKTVLKKFRGVSESVLREAFREYVLEDIMTG
jgi:hypothetical protein